jgi:hypothetical protein
VAVASDSQGQQYAYVADQDGGLLIFRVTESYTPEPIEKSVTPQGQVAYGDEITYTLVISAAPGAQIGLYDPLASTTFLRFVERPLGVSYDGAISGTLQIGTVTGTLTVPATSTGLITVSFVAQVGLPGTTELPTSIRNRACVYPIEGTLGGCTWSNEVSNPVWLYSVYLPMVALRGD